MSDKVIIKNSIGKLVEATAPVIISASRSTDIPAFLCQVVFQPLGKRLLCLVQSIQSAKDVYLFL